MDKARSERQRVQRRWDVEPVRYESFDGELLVESAEVYEAAQALLSVLDCLRRKGREGTR